MRVDGRLVVRDGPNMQTFDQDLIALYRDGLIELEDALSVATNPRDLQVALRSQGLVA
jgi:twitching motility protein PilT